MSAPEQFSNNAQTTLVESATAVQTTIHVTDARRFPAQPQFRILISDPVHGDEIMVVTGGAGGTRWTVERGQEGTTAVAHEAGAIVTQSLTAAALRSLRTPICNVRDYGARGDGRTDDTDALQAAIDAASHEGGVAYVPASPAPYLFSTLKLMPYMKLAGAHMWKTQLKRIPGAKGSALREKTVGEGNPFGPTGTWIETICVDGSGTPGNGIDLGNHGEYQLSSFAGIANVLVFGFPAGAGFHLNSNASSFSYLWANHNDVGVRVTGGGANVFHSVFAENNKRYQLHVLDSYNKFFGVQVELDASSDTSSAVRVEGYENYFSGIYVSLAGDRHTIIENAAGANRNAYYAVNVAPNGHRFTDLIRHDGFGIGTGPKDTLVHAFVIGESGLGSSWYVNGSTGKTIELTADVMKTTIGIAIPTKAGPPADADFANPHDGLLVADTKNNKLWIRLGGVWKAIRVGG